MLLIFWKTLMALGVARKCFTSTEPWYPALPNRKGLIWAASALASYRLLLGVHRACLPFPMDLKVAWSSSPYQQVNQGIQEKNFPRGGEEGGNSSRSDFLVSAFKNQCISICWQGYQFFFCHEWGFMIHMVFFFYYIFFFPLRKKMRDTERDFA